MGELRFMLAKNAHPGNEYNTSPYINGKSLPGNEQGAEGEQNKLAKSLQLKLKAFYTNVDQELLHGVIITLLGVIVVYLFRATRLCFGILFTKLVVEA